MYKWFSAIQLLPKDIRDLNGIDTIHFKDKSDEFLCTIPNEPQCCGYTGYRRAKTNSLLHVVTIIFPIL